MAKSIETRLARLEAEVGRSDIYTAALEAIWELERATSRAAAGLTADDLIDEAQLFLAQPLAAQLAEVDTLTEAHATEGLDVGAIKATLIREYRPR
jgi:hypothetical protein